MTEITAAFLRKRFVVLKPISDNLRFDLVIDRGNGFERVQCKTGRMRKGAIQFNSCSTSAYGYGGRSHYKGDADIFAVYCPETDKVYVIPVDAAGETQVKLRVAPAKNRQKSRVRLAADYEILADPISNILPSADG